MEKDVDYSMSKCYGICWYKIEALSIEAFDRGEYLR
jgi:hypothetical protein